ncbi:MAG: Rieske 2Fe-2S domain-containing protein [Gammaproteobacteria bacterium]|nr:Rieske 2Fe-2S domain-containing protein [Gammaproteobacteria bacterium]
MSERMKAVACLADLGDPGTREFFVGEGDWPFRGFLVQVNGRLRAYANVCPHKRHPLNLADDEFLVPGQALLRCASHGALFEPESGLCVFGPCAGRSLTPLECRVENGEVLVKTGDLPHFQGK